MPASTREGSAAASVYSGMRIRPTLPLVLALAGLAISQAASPVSASAADYEVQVCTATTQDGITVADDLGTNANHTFMNSCGQTAANIVQSAGGNASIITGGNHWTLAAPPDTRLSNVVLDRSFSGPWDSSNDFRWEVRTQEGSLFDVLVANGGAVPAAERIIYPNLNSASITAHLFCRAVNRNCARSPTGLSVTVGGIVAQLQDLSPPSLLGEPTGSLLAGGALRGMQSVLFTAHDEGSGIARTALVVDDVDAVTVSDANGGKCQLPYTSLVPCQRAILFHPTLDTTTIPDGDHRVQVAVVDAAGQRTLSDPVTVTIHNAPTNTDAPRAVGQAQLNAPLSATSGAWDGAPTAFAFQWLRCPSNVTAATVAATCAPIVGATSPLQYALGSDDVGGRVVVEVTATNASGSESAFSAPTVPIGDGRGTPPGADTTAPALSSVSLSHARFRIAKAATAIAAAKRVPRGTALRFTSSEAGTLSVLIERVRPGQKVKQGAKRVCKVVRRRVKRGRCSVYTRVSTLTRAIQAGPGSLALSGRIAAKRMAPGSYRLTLTARDAAGNSSKPTSRTFRILAG